MDLETFKEHQLIEHNNDDVIITHYLEAAEQAVTNYLHHDYDPLNKTHIQAKFLIAGSWYAFRENEIALNLHSVPLGVKFLLDMDMSVAI